MAYSGAGLVQRFWGSSDAEADHSYVEDLIGIYPQLVGHLFRIHRWRRGLPNPSPAPEGVQPAFEVPHGRICRSAVVVGVECVETAINIGVTAVCKIRAHMLA